MYLRHKNERETSKFLQKYTKIPPKTSIKTSEFPHPFHIKNRKPFNGTNPNKADPRSARHSSPNLRAQSLRALIPLPFFQVFLRISLEEDEGARAKAEEAGKHGRGVVDPCDAITIVEGVRGCQWGRVGAVETESESGGE